LVCGSVLGGVFVAAVGGVIGLLRSINRQRC
jgi:hypothetical protein